MSTTTENNLQTSGTISNSGGLSVEEAEKVFAEAYTKISPSQQPSVSVESTETPPEETKKEEPVAAKEEVVPAATDNKEETDTKPEVPVSTDPYAWLESVSDQDLKSKILQEIQARSDAEHRFRSANGRVTALRQEQLALHKRLAEQARPQTSESAPEASKAPKTIKEWEALIENDPELAKAVEARLDSRVNELEQRIEQRFGTFKESAIDPLYDHQSKQYFEREAELLAQAVPNYVEVINSPEWKAWLEDKPVDIQKAISSSQNHQDALKAFRWFADDMVRVGWDKNSPFRRQAPQSVQQPAKVVAPTEQAEKLAKEREEKLKATAVVTASAPIPVATKAPNTSGLTLEDADKIFNEAYNKFNRSAR